MSETLSIWLFAGCYALGCFAVLSVAKMAFSFSQRLTIIETRWETFMEGIGKRAAAAVHRDDNMHGIDGILDKYLANHFLSPDEWGAVKVACEKMLIEKTISSDLKIGYVLLAAVCEDKMKPYKEFWKTKNAGPATT